MSEDVRINLHPDTGHHYARVPIRAILDFGSEHKNAEALEALRQQFAQRGEELRRWQSWKEIGAPWLRYSYELTSDFAESEAQPILCLAIETNLGDETRNWPLDQPDPGPDLLAAAANSPLPYIAEDERKLTEKTEAAGEGPVPAGAKDAGGKRYARLTFLPGPFGNFRINLVVYFKVAGTDQPIDTDLVVDLGNTRLLALLVESRESGRQDNREDFGERCRPVWFTPRCHPFVRSTSGVGNHPYAMVDSWMLLIEPPFAHLEPPRSFEQVMRAPANAPYPLGMPHSFIEIAPGQLGGGSHRDGALKLYGRSALANHLFSWSSPKRYAWADEAREAWAQMSPSGEGGQTRYDPFHEIRGLLRYLMSPHGPGNDLDLEQLRRDGRLGSGLRPALSEKATFAPADTICWFALAILEQAWRQINDHEYQEVAQQDIRRRRLRDIYVTFPAGWVWEERERYFAQWKRAIRLFSETRFPDSRPIAEGGHAPQMVEHAHDEAVCSQVPVLYSHFRRFRGESVPWRWFQLYGRFETGPGQDPAEGRGEVRVMNIDVGGGTTDNAVIRYNYEGPRSASAKLLFKDSNSVAGDLVVQKILEQVLLPRWLGVNFPEIARVLPNAAEHVCNLFFKPLHEEIRHIDGKAEARIKRALRLLFIPLVNRWLGMLARLEDPDAPLDDLVLTTADLDVQVLDDLNRLLVCVIACKAGRWLEPDDQPPPDKLELAKWANARIDRVTGTVVPLAPPTAESPIRLRCRREELEACFHEVFQPLLPKWAHVLARYQCDLVILSGKPSEIPYLQRLILRHLPVLPQRFLQMKLFNAGAWYPSFAADFNGEVTDAKTCTAVGAAALQDGLLRQFRLSGDLSTAPAPGQPLQETFEWCRLSDPLHPEQAGNVTPLFGATGATARPCPEEGEGAMAIAGEVPDIRPGDFIGRRIANAPEATVEPVYEFRLEPMPEPGVEAAPVSVSLERIVHPRRGE
ncbi:MAG: virulence factor SrfB, partial [Opitutales bacterium]